MTPAAAALAPTGPVIPDYSAHSSRCVVENHAFCGEWVSHNWGSVLWPALRQHVMLTAIAVAIGFVIAMVLALAAHRYGALERPTLFVTTFL
jgi:osmoprotectant transport system permease protein